MIRNASLLIIYFLATFLVSVQSFSPESPSSKAKLLNEFDDANAFNEATKQRSRLVAELTKDNPTTAPGSTKSFSPLAVGTWRIVYAPHISTMGGLFSGSFDPVYYILKPNGIMTSHARYNFPIIGSGWLSVSGTYSSEDEDQVCRVDFDKTWIKINKNDDADAKPYESLEDVPSSGWKDFIQETGKFFFIDSVSVFPVSYLDDDTIVFDFELLGTRICARKIGPPQ